MSAGRMTMQEALYERPGPKTKKKIAIFTTITIILIAILLGLVVYQFYINGQLDRKYWYFFLRLSTWKFLGKGLIGTVEAAVLAGIMTFILGFLYTRCSDSVICLLFLFSGTAIWYQPAKYLTYFTSGCDIGIGNCCRGTSYRNQCDSKRTERSSFILRFDQCQGVFENSLSAGFPLCDSVFDFRDGYRCQGYDICLCS